MYEQIHLKFKSLASFPEYWEISSKCAFEGVIWHSKDERKQCEIGRTTFTLLFDMKLKLIFIVINDAVN